MNTRTRLYRRQRLADKKAYVRSWPWLRKINISTGEMRWLVGTLAMCPTKNSISDSRNVNVLRRRKMINAETVTDAVTRMFHEACESMDEWDEILEDLFDDNFCDYIPVDRKYLPPLPRKGKTQRKRERRAVCRVSDTWNDTLDTDSFWHDPGCHELDEELLMFGTLDNYLQGLQ